MRIRGTIQSLEEARKTIQKLKLYIDQRLPSWGTEFINNPVEGKIFTRTDLSITYQYINGTWTDISTGGDGGTPDTNYLLWMSGERFEYMDGTDFILMSALA